MPPRGVKGKKNTRQYEHIKESELKEGRSSKVAKRIAAATVNKRRASEKRSRAAKKGARKRTTARKGAKKK
jgi:hypothetical protein